MLGRLFEKICATQLIQYCNAKEIIPIQQFGFRPKSSCEIALITATDSWMCAIDKGEVVGAILIDLSKAFDTVSHQKLLLELRKIGLSGDSLAFFCDYLTGRSQRVVQKPTSTDWKDVSRGVPQGSCLSPLLFNIYVRAIPSLCSSCTVQFADDVTHSDSDRDPSVVARRLEESFNSTKRICDELELSINTNKTQFIMFKSPSKKLPADLSINLDGVLIEPSLVVKLLGVTLDRHLTFKEHINIVVQKCRGLAGVLRRAAPRLPSELLRLAYVSLVRSQLEYASGVFASIASTHLNKLDTIQKICSRIATHQPRCSHSAPLIEHLQLESLSNRRSMHLNKLIHSILTNECHPALHRLFED